MPITRTIQLAYKVLPTFILFCIPIGVHRLMTRFKLNQSKYTLDGVLGELSCPLLLLWGDLDPWVGPAKANRIKEFYPKTSLVNLKAGHCVHMMKFQSLPIRLCWIDCQVQHLKPPPRRCNFVQI